MSYYYHKTYSGTGKHKLNKKQRKIIGHFQRLFHVLSIIACIVNIYYADTADYYALLIYMMAGLIASVQVIAFIYSCFEDKFQENDNFILSVQVIFFNFVSLSS